MSSIQKIMTQTFLNNSVAQYLTAAGVLAACLVALFLADRLLLRRLEKWTAAAPGRLDGVLVGLARRSLFPLLTVGAFALSLRGLNLHESVDRVVSLAWTGFLTVFGVRSLLDLASHFLGESAPPGKTQAAEALLPILHIALWSLGIIFFLDNAGVRISAVVAGLGIGGVAVALAAQAVLGDFFSHVAILFDRPFVVVDFIVVDDLMGTVERIGVKTTRVRSLGGEILVFPNAALTGSRIRNFQAMRRRRVAFKFGLAYETPTEKLREVPGLMKRIIAEARETSFDRAHFASYGESSLDFEAVYYVLTADQNRYMDIQQEINLRMKEEFERRGLSFAHPTRRIYAAGAVPVS